MGKRFILLIDFSEYSGNLIKYAYEWSIKVNAKLILVHKTMALVPAFAASETRQHIYQNENDEALIKLKGLVNALIPNSLNVSYSVSERPLQFILTKLLSEAYENFIFVGLKGTGLLKKIFLGSVAIQVIESIQGITVAIPKEISVFSQGKIFVAIAEKYALNIRALNRTLNLFDKENTSITFFHLAKRHEKANEVEDRVRELSVLFANRFNTNFCIYEGEHPFEDIKKVINRNVNEILIVQKGSRLLTDQLFRKFVINELVYEGQTPLIVLP